MTCLGTFEPLTDNSFSMMVSTFIYILRSIYIIVQIELISQAKAYSGNAQNTYYALSPMSERREVEERM